MLTKAGQELTEYQENTLPDTLPNNWRGFFFCFCLITKKVDDICKG